jgi:O-antigen/teichoic acid export membrane protein
VSAEDGGPSPATDTPLADAVPGDPAAGRPGLPRIARGSILNLLGAGVSTVLNIALTIVITRSLPKDTAGTFFTLTTLFLLAETVACLGTQTGLVYFIARTRSLGEPQRIRQFQRAAFVPALGLAVVAVVAFAAWSPALAHVAGGGPAAREAVLVLAVLLPMAVLSDTGLAGTRGYATMVPTVAVERTGRPLVQLGLVALAAAGGSLWQLAGAWALPYLASGLLACWWLLRLGRRVSAETRTQPAPGVAWSEFWSFTWARAVSSVVQLALQRADIVLITVLIGPAHAAVYTAATRFLVVGQLSSTSVANAAQPRLAELMAVGDRSSAKQIYQSATAWIVLLTWPLYLLCIMFAEPVLSVFGSSYTGGVGVVVVLSAAMLLATACGMVDMLLNMAGRTSWTLANSVLGLTVMVAVDLLLIPRLGILGAGIGWAAAIAANNLLPLTQLLVAYRLHPFGRATLSAAGLAAFCFGALPGIAALVLPGRLLPLGGGVLVGALLYAAACLRWRSALGLPPLSTFRPRGGRKAQSAPRHPAAVGGSR